jgi:hypothetical protein
MTNNKQQTAVEWQFEQLFNSFEKFNNDEYTFDEYLKRNLEIRAQAKEMEKERMIDFANNCIKQIEVSDTCELLMVESPKDLYEQTYGGGE